jgi:hypothetical protein
MSWSIVAGVAGAIGAFGVLLAFAAGGKPPVVMSIIFAGAPVINAVVALMLHPPHGGLRTIDARFWLGIIFAAAGGFMVTKFKPAPPKPAAPVAAVASAASAPVAGAATH